MRRWCFQRSTTRHQALYFDAHRDLLPDEVARALGGSIVWQGERKGEWAAVLRFNRAYEARVMASE